MELLVITLTAAVIVALLVVLRRLGSPAPRDRVRHHNSDTHHERVRPCPLCGSLLRRGEQVHTIVFSGETVGPDGQTRPPRIRESMVHMVGCRYCRPPEGVKERTCPACKGVIRPEGYAIARMFERDGRRHVHVLGCTVCRHGR